MAGAVSPLVRTHSASDIGPVSEAALKGESQVLSSVYVELTRKYGDHHG
jgi:hypothetical protein